MTQFEVVRAGTVTTPAGFTAGGTYAGVKKKGKNVLDLGIIYSDVPCLTAGVFTKNRIKSAAVVVNLERLRKENVMISAIVVNSGCANSSTGEQGLTDAKEVAMHTAKALGVEPEEVLVGSTGVIGVRLPVDLIKEGVRNIALSRDGGHEFERAIMTTDTVPKEIALKVTTDKSSFSMGGVAKGSGMIHPDLATMLVYLTTDAAVTPGFLGKALRKAVAVSFNMISVDGDTSPSDTVILLANGLAGNKPITRNSASGRVFQSALTQVCIYLAKAIARDGEGATKLIEVTVTGALTTAEAKRAARTIVSSNLVKAAVYGMDPNWGRVTAALGRSNVRIEESKLDVTMAGILVLKNGSPVLFERQAAVAALGNNEIQIIVDLHLGEASATAWGCDLTEQYVVINSAYTT